MKSPRRAHFIAIGGTGMGSLAGLLKARGVDVSGSDAGLYPPMSTALERWQIPVNEGFSAGNLAGIDPDLYVIGNAVRPDNPEACAAIESGVPYLSFSDALYELAIAGKHSVVVSGTHGKTTTTNLTAFLLHEAGRDPSLLVGGISLDFDGSFREGGGEHFVVEGDEYDTAFFDKTPKFLHYHPQTLILTSVEFDHADIYRDLEHVKSAFRDLVAKIPPDGTIIAATGHANVSEVLADARCRVISYAVSGDLPPSSVDWRASDLQASPDGTRFELQAPAGRATVELPLHGAFNVENALAALAAATGLGVPLAEAVDALRRVRGVKRRQEVRGEADGMIVIDDFAHHPTAVRETLAAMRTRYSKRELWAVFEPRTNTSRRRFFEDEYVEALSGADRVVIAGVYHAEQIPEAERMRPDRVASELSARGVDAIHLPEIDDIIDRLVRHRSGRGVALIMSNGEFGGIWDHLLARLQKAAS